MKVPALDAPALCLAALLVISPGAAAHEVAHHSVRSPPAVTDPESDCAKELAQIDEQLAKAGESETIFWLYTKASLTGDPDDWNGAWHLVGGDEELPASGELLLYRATIALELHRPGDAETALDRLDEMDPHLAGGTYPKLLRGDVARAREQLDEARRIYEAVLAVERSWKALSRVAYLERDAGRYRKADKLYAEAQELLTVKEMRRWAWLELQRGMVDLDRGDEVDAEEHFRRAERAYSGTHTSARPSLE